MKLTPYPSSRFSDWLSSNYTDFRQALYQCQISTLRLQANDFILRQGQVVDQLMVVPVGCISMNISAVNGRRFQLGEVNCDYSLFGEIEFFTKTPCQWSVIADERLDIDVLCVKKIEKMLSEQPQYAIYFASALAQDYYDSLDIYTHRLLHPITYNIAYDLLQHGDSLALLGRFSQVNKEAERFGTSSRVYRRAVKTLVEAGLVEKVDSQLRIIDRAGLQQFIEGLD
ncbi:Crp/Fnr family transcriptional regulator [Shewanella marina]|uniref:Crp/Fnr family transcriptional regulator n=1 Tax=Shewanella marina TaxID=487319 RepID=UPI000472BB97|nr:Crp/Fnr family transcriptional regulator [Shewanella marina]